MENDEFIARRRELARLIEDISEEFYDSNTTCDYDAYLASRLIDEGYVMNKPTPLEFWGDSCDENGNIIYDNAKCPSCDNDDFEYGINNWGCAYCPDCGQALDWGENE